MGQAGDLMNALWALEPAYLRASSSLRTPLTNYDEKLGRTARLYHSVFYETGRLRPSVHASRLAVGTPPEMNELKNRAHPTSVRPCESPHREAPLTHSLTHSLTLTTPSLDSRESTPGIAQQPGLDNRPPHPPRTRPIIVEPPSVYPRAPHFRTHVVPSHLILGGGTAQYET